MPTEIDRYLGRRLRRRRKELHLTQAQVAVAVSVRFQQIQKYESGAQRMSAAGLWLIAESLECPVSYFYEGLAEELTAKKGARAKQGSSRKAAPKPPVASIVAI